MRAEGVNAVPQHPGKTDSRESASFSVSKHDFQLIEYHVPILAPSMPVPDDPLGCQIEHSPQRIVIGKRGLVLCDLTKLPVQALDNVRRVYDLPNLWRIFKEGAQDFPVIFPALYAGRILFAPGISKDA